MTESFDERARRWERSFEDLFIEISKERSEEGLAFSINICGALYEINSLLESVRKARGLANKNPATLVSRSHDKFNEE